MLAVIDLEEFPCKVIINYGTCSVSVEGIENFAVIKKVSEIFEIILDFLVVAALEEKQRIVPILEKQAFSQVSSHFVKARP